MTEKYIVTGLVQGIGFRPAVKRIADELGIKGTVKNSGGAAEITASGKRLAEFFMKIKNIPYAEVDNIEAVPAPDEECDGFRIINSDSEAECIPVIPADIATCDGCLAEFDDPANRRFRHPFISCTACGPRYSIIDKIPYDRSNTVMKDFELCTECGREYTDIIDIRCHAQTIACNTCGPRLSFTLPGDPLEEAAKTLKNGGIAAIKDIGGYHFACDANNADAAKRLRQIKGRETKPFAVMFNSMADIKEYAYVSKSEEKALTSAARPIVLLRKKKDLAAPVCGMSSSIGAFLPCNPVQYELTKHCGALVMTSANLSGQPIVTDNDTIFKLRERLGGFEILSHDRAVLTPLDDSVCREVAGRMRMIRRARGYVPAPLEIELKRDIAVFAAGGDLKASFCYAKGGKAYMSQYFGDLEDARAYETWEGNAKRLGRLLGIEPEKYVSDLHPGYISGSFREGEKLQHHFAHMASVMAEHKLSESALGFVFDGTGYGEDGCIRGGEIISYNGGFKRESGLSYTELLGGDESAKNSALTADCFLIGAGLEPESGNAAIAKAALRKHINTVRSSSMGRLFDAVSSILGVSKYNTYEGESAIMLEQAAERAKEAYPLELRMVDGRWDSAVLIRDIYTAKSCGADIKSIALGFHRAIADAVCEYVKRQDERTVILSGGVFANKLLTELCVNGLEGSGCGVYLNEKVPTNDGGIALGQVWYIINH